MRVEKLLSKNINYLISEKFNNSDQDFAKEFSTSLEDIINWKKGNTQPNDSAINKMSEIIGVDYFDFFQRDVEKMETFTEIDFQIMYIEECENIQNFFTELDYTIEIDYLNDKKNNPEKVLQLMKNKLGDCYHFGMASYQARTKKSNMP